MKKKTNYITPNGLQKLLDEQEELIKVERPEVCKVVTWAASLGDRSENADYQYGKKRLREIDKRLRFLKLRIEDAVPVDPVKSTSTNIKFGATVCVENEDGERKIYSIVGIDETDSKKNYISWKSPIGTSLLGREIGDVVLVTTPKGKVELEIISIEYKELL